MLTKTMSFAVVHFTVAFTVGYLLSGSVLIGSAIAMVEPAVNTVAYYFHEKFWNRLSAQRRSNLPRFSTGGKGNATLYPQLEKY